MRELRTYLVGSAIVLVLYLVAQYYKPKPTDWTSTYLREDKIPFGLYILDHELNSIFPNTTVKTSGSPVYNTLNGRKFENTNYLFISGSLKLDSLDFRELIKFVNHGNHVFIAAYDLGTFLKDTLQLQVKPANMMANNNVSIYFVNPALEATQSYSFKKEIANQYFSKFDTLRATILGKNENGDANFLKYAFGKGALYILPNPQLLTNYSLINPRGADYAAKALSYLPVSKTLIWDEFNTRGSVADSSILRVLFNHDQLRWAYEITIAGLLVFVLFEIKRRQRIIPVIAPLQNSSVDFVKVVGKVYYQQRDNRDIVHKKINYFLEHIRVTYRLKTTAIDQELANSLMIKSGVNEDTIRQLFSTIQNINQLNKVSDQQLIDLNKQIEKFQTEAQ